MVSFICGDGDKKRVMMLLLALVSLPDAFLNEPYQEAAPRLLVSTRCAGIVPHVRLAGGKLPPGLELNGRGELTGIATEPGDYRFVVETSDGCSRRTEERRLRVGPLPILVAEADTLEFRCVQGAPPFPAGLVRVSGSAPGRAYSVDILETPWLSATMRSGVLPAEGLALEADTVQIGVNPAKLAPGVHYGRLRVSTWQGANAPELRFRLKVEAVETLLAPAGGAPAPLTIRLPYVEAPSVTIIDPPAFAPSRPPALPKRYQPTRTAAAGDSKIVLPRSRVLPFPKVVIKPLPQGEANKEAPPERTKPSAMPAPAKSATAPAAKPAAGAH